MTPTCAGASASRRERRAVAEFDYDRLARKLREALEQMSR